MGPVWDFDLAFGNFLMDNPRYNDWATLGTNSNDILDRKILEKITHDNLVRDDKDNYIVVNWFNFLLTDDTFVSRLKERWFQIRETVYNTAVNAVDKGQNMIGHDYIDDMTLWYDYGKKRGHQSYASSTFTTYQEHISYLRNFIITRYKWLDNAIVKLKASAN